MPLEIGQKIPPAPAVNPKNPEGWTDDFLNEMRQQGDTDFDDYITSLLSCSALQDFKGVFAAWTKTQADQIAEAKQISDSLSDGNNLPPEAIQKIDKLNEQQTQQFVALELYGYPFWPREFNFHIANARLAMIMACKALTNRRLEAALAAMNYAQTNVTLLEGHYEQLLAQVAAQPDLRQQMEVRNRIAYNRFLEIVEVIRRSPSLFLLNESLRKAQFESYPTGLTGSFEPTECPDWVDAEKLNLGLRLWQKDMVACLFVLFAESLPDCYLIKKGIPMLYRTERLGSQKYLAQRIYETGFMLRDVLRENGMFLLSQTAAVQVLWLAATVHKVKPDWTFQFDRFLEPEWTDAQGQTYSQADVMADPAIQQAFGTLQQQAPPPDKFSAAELGTPSFNWLFRFCLEGAPPPGFDYYGDRYLWGAGFLAAVKVRFFHASMRYYALQGNPPYDAKENGMPINQEDLAYTLLTFGYVIPQGVEKLGGLVSRAEKEAFLHCWKIVGHLMGVDPRLLTDDWDEARQLFDKIKSRQQASSEKGVALTRALCTFIEDLLPVWLPFRRAIAPVLIRDQLGADADELFDTPMAGASRNLAVRATWVVVKNLLLRVFFLSRYAFFNRTPYTRAFTDDVLRFLGDALIESWRQSFERQPFNLTCGEKGFEPNPEVTPAEHQEREAFRRKVFQGAALGLGLILMFHLCFWIGAFSLAAWQFCPTPRFASAARAVFLSMFWACLIEITWVYLVERKLRAWLRVLEFKPQPAL